MLQIWCLSSVSRVQNDIGGRIDKALRKPKIDFFFASYSWWRFSIICLVVPNVWRCSLPDLFCELLLRTKKFIVEGSMFWLENQNWKDSTDSGSADLQTRPGPRVSTWAADAPPRDSHVNIWSGNSHHLLTPAGSTSLQWKPLTTLCNWN